MEQTCILVLGMHRSGTSALAGMLNLLDIYLSDTIKGDENNQKGYFENWKVQQLNDRILEKINSNWADEFFNSRKLDNLNIDISELKNIIKNDFEYSNIFAIKDPRVCLLFPLWKTALEELDINIKIIITYRNPIEVANSLNKRDGMPLEKGMLLWAYHFLLAEKFSRGYDRIFINFDELMSNTSKIVDDISKKLHIDFSEKFNKNKKDIKDFLEPSLKHHNISMDNLSDNTPKIVKDILTLKERFNDNNLENEFDSLRKELFSYQKLFYNSSIVSSLHEGQRAKQSLQSKEKELRQTKEALTQKDKELSRTKQSLQSKEQELRQTKQELDNLKTELTNIYISKSWKLTRPLRRFMRIVRK